MFKNHAGLLKNTVYSWTFHLDFKCFYKFLSFDVEYFVYNLKTIPFNTSRLITRQPGDIAALNYTLSDRQITGPMSGYYQISILFHCRSTVILTLSVLWVFTFVQMYLQYQKARIII